MYDSLVLNPLSEQWEAQLGAWCADAGCSALQTECLLLYAEGMTWAQIRLKLHGALRRDGDVKRMVGQALEKVTARHPEIHEAGDRFSRWLVLAARNRDDHDVREPGVRGVAPDRASQGFQGVQMVPADRAEIVQDSVSCLRRWVEQNRPVLVAVA